MNDAVAARDDVVWRADESLARHLPRRTGGTCDAWIVVHSHEALGVVDSALRDEGLSRTVLGTGSRVLVRDGGLSGAVVRLGLDFAHLRPDEDGAVVGAAVPLARVGVAAGDGPLSALRRQPGSLGASLRLDGGWTPWVRSVDVFSRGRVKTISLDELAGMNRVVVVGARLRWHREGGSRARRLPGVERPWSVFEEVPRADVSRLLVRAGLAGTRLRDVLLPEAEPTSATNLGTATARDVELLLRSVCDRMKRERGVDLSVGLTTLGRVS